MAWLHHHLTKHAATVKRHVWNAFVPHEGNDHRPHALRHKALTAYAIAIIVVKVAVSGIAIVYPGPSTTSDLTQAQIIKLTNAARTSNGLKSLTANSALNAGALLKANDMLSKQYFAHISPTNVTPWYWFKKAGYNYTAAGENLAIDFTTSEDVVNAWLASPSHRKNLLNTQYKDIGVAVVDGKMNGVDSTVIVQFFGVPVTTKVTPKTTTTPKVTTPVKPTTPAKPSSVAVASPVKQPVLGEQTVVTPDPPATPKITSPDEGNVLATARPWIGGESQPGVAISIFSDGMRIAQTTSDAKGYFAVQPTEDLTDGTHTVSAVAMSNGLTSGTSVTRSVTVDTKPPAATLSHVIILPSYLRPGSLTVSGTIAGTDVASAQVVLGQSGVALSSADGPFFIQMTPAAGSGSDMITVQLKDAIGNETLIPVASLSFLDVDILQPATEGFAEVAPRIIFFSQKFFLTFWLFLFLVLAVNVIVKIRIQHRPMILYSLLLLYGLTILVVTA